jgi:hypothetical protein
LPASTPIRVTRGGHPLADGTPTAGLALPTGEEAWAGAGVYPAGWALGDAAGSGGAAAPPTSGATPAHLAGWALATGWAPGRAATVPAAAPRAAATARAVAGAALAVLVAGLNLAL